MSSLGEANAISEEEFELVDEIVDEALVIERGWVTELDYLYSIPERKLEGEEFVHSVFDDGWRSCCRLNGVRSDWPEIDQGKVFIYAWMGLHRYNFTMGTNYEFVCAKRYNRSRGGGAGSYFITFDAKDPATDELKTFRTIVNESRLGRLAVTCYLSILREDTLTWPDHPQLFDDSLPEPPTENPFLNTKRFRVLNQSEMQANHDWIRLYLYLAVGTSNWSTICYPDLSTTTLSIVKVAMDAREHANGNGLNANNATFYIRYKDLCEPRVGKDVDRLAIVGRHYDEQSGCFRIVGQNLSAATLPKKHQDKASGPHS